MTRSGMNVEPAIIYAVVVAIVGALGILWRKFEASHAECIKERKECHQERKELIEHNIAQQHDIRTLKRGHAIELQSERTQFFKKHIEGEGAEI